MFDVRRSKQINDKTCILYDFCVIVVTKLLDMAYI